MMFSLIFIFKKKFDCDDEIYIYMKYISLIVKNKINGLFPSNKSLFRCI